MCHRHGLGARPISDEEYMKPFLERLNSSEGAGRRDVPFLGYIEMDIGFPFRDAGTDKGVSTLVLSVPDNSCNQRVPLI